MRPTRSPRRSVMRTHRPVSARSRVMAIAFVADGCSLPDCASCCSGDAVELRPMIGRLSGTLLEKNPPQLLLDVQGVAYEVDVPMSTFYNLPQSGERITLFTHLVVREDAHLLYGFGTENERRAFRQLLKVNGIGAKIALALLSGLSVAELAQAITLQEAGRLTRVPGIGKKTAERLLLELKDKLGADITHAVGVNRPAHANSDITHALLSLGYSEREAVAAVKQLPDGVGVSDGIKQALRLLAKP